MASSTELPQWHVVHVKFDSEGGGPGNTLISNYLGLCRARPALWPGHGNVWGASVVVLIWLYLLLPPPAFMQPLSAYAHDQRIILVLLLKLTNLEWCCTYTIIRTIGESWQNQICYQSICIMNFHAKERILMRACKDSNGYTLMLWTLV